MKKILISISLICYLFVNSGMVVSFHYCMNHLESTRFFVSAKMVCSKCGMQAERSGCCPDVVKVVKLRQDPAIISSLSGTMAANAAFISIPSRFIAASFQNVDNKNDFLSHPPPLLSDHVIYRKINVFRI